MASLLGTERREPTRGSPVHPPRKGYWRYRRYRAGQGLDRGSSQWLGSGPTRYPHHGRRCGDAYDEGPGPATGDLDGDLVFTTETGAPLDPANLRRTLRRMARQADIPGDWTLYNLRHTAVSIMSDSGVNIESIADAAGHRNSRGDPGGVPAQHPPRGDQYSPVGAVRGNRGPVGVKSSRVKKSGPRTEPSLALGCTLDALGKVCVYMYIHTYKYASRAQTNSMLFQSTC